MRSFAILCLMLTSSSALAEEFDQSKAIVLGQILRDCLDDRAKYYSGKTCLPPSELIPALYSACEAEERNAREELKKTRGSWASVDGTMSELTDRLRPELTRIIVDGQMQRDCK